MNKRQKWWLPVIGPTATSLAFLLARYAAHGDTTWNTGTLARVVGLSGNRSKLWASLERLSTFGLLTFAATDLVTIRLYMPPLTARRLAMLRDDLAVTYRTLALALALA